MPLLRLPRNIGALSIVILIAAFAIRVIGLDEKSFWYDEGYTAVFAQNSVAHIVVGAAQLELNTPLHYLLLKFWMLGAGQSEFATRLLSAFAGLITVAAASQCVTHRASQPLALLLVALSSVCISLGQETRMYSLLVCFGTLAVAQLQRCLRANTTGAWACWAAFNLTAFATHVLGAILFGAQVLAMLGLFASKRQRPQRPAHKLFWVATTLTGLGMVAVLTPIALAGQSYGTTYTGRLDYLSTLFNGFAALVLPRLQPEGWQPTATIVVALLLPVAIARRRARFTASITLISLMGIAALCALTGKFAARYAAIVAPLFLATVSAFVLIGRSARGDSSAPSTATRATNFAQASVAICLVVGITLGTWQWRTHPIYANEDFRGAAQYIRANAPDDEAVLLVSGHFAPVFAYYFGEAGWYALPNDPVLNVRNALSFDSAMPALNTALRGKRGAWLLLWQDDVIDPTALTQALLRRQANRLQPEPDTPQFTGLRLHHYRFNQPYQPLPEALPAPSSKLEALGQARGLLGLGCHSFRPARAGDALMEIFCLWQVEAKNSLPYNTQISLRLFAASGQMVAQSDQQLAPDGLPSTRFDKVITAIYFVPLPTNTPAGSYSLQAIPYTAEGEVSPRATTPIEIK